MLALPELLDEALEASGYRAMLADGSEDGEERWANLLELRSVTTRYDDLAPDDALDRLLEETALVADQDSYEGDADAVTLITLHAAKGLEFPVVFIAGLEEGLFPHSRALDDEKELEEERRLAYVGITRAKRRLYLSHAWRRATWGMGQAVGPVAVPARDPGRADDRAAARRRRTTATSTSTSSSGRGGRAGSARRSAGGGRGAFRQGSGRPGAPARRRAVPARAATSPRSARRSPTGAHSGSLGRPVRAWDDDLDSGVGGRRRGPRPRRPPRPVIPGERQFRDGDRVRHGRWGDGIVVTSKLTRSDEEVTVAFKDPAVGRKTMLGEPRQPRDRRVTDGARPARRGSPRSPTSSRSPGRRWTRRPSTTSRAAPGTRSRSPRTRRRGGAGGSGRASSSTSRRVDPSHDACWASRSPCPVAIAPMAVQGLAHPDAELAAARGAAAAGIPFILSTTSSRSIEEVAAAAPDAPRWFQLYVQSDAARTRSLVERAAAAGYGAIVLTVDLPGARLPRPRSAVRVRAAPARQLPRGRGDARQPRRRRAAELQNATIALTWADLARDPGLVRRCRWSSRGS